MKIPTLRLLLFPLVLILVFLGLGLGWWILPGSSPRVVEAAAVANNAVVSGIVVDGDSPVIGAHVRVRATENLTFTDDTGNFSLSGLDAGGSVEVTAWLDGYYVASTIVTPTVSGVIITLRPFHTHDHPDYEWIAPTSGSSPKACGNCHPMIISQWEENAHGLAISNPRFFSLYTGTDLSGTQQVLPGYLTDFPGTAGNCASCHAPGAGVDGYMTTDLNSERGKLLAGIHCDFCHKVGGAYLDPGSGSVYPNSPGVQSQRILRPPAGDNIFFGPYDDIADPDTYLPLTQQSQFCAPCHQFSFWGTPIYESYSEWLASPYAEAGVTCQDCHMLPTGESYFALPEVGGLPHPPDSIPSHLQVGAADEVLLQNTVTMTLDTDQMGNQVWVTVAITNTAAGHHVPTDHPGRHLILTVRAKDDHGLLLPQTSGGTVPDWGGTQANLPGKAYAKVLRDAVTGAYPVVNYWKQSFILSDNRIPAFASDRSTYAFTTPSNSQTVTIEAELLFRRSYQTDMDARNWDMADIQMEKIQQTVTVSPEWHLFFPVVWR